jgi:hypothetical protein
MPVQHLIVSVPPHPETWRVDAAAIAFGATPAEVRVLASYAAPEIWYALPDEAAAEDKYDELSRTRLSIVFTDSTILARVPPRAEVRSFQVAKAGIVWDLGDERTYEMSFRARALLVYGRPRTAAAASKSVVRFKDGGPADRAAFQNPAFLDLYLEEEDRTMHLSIVPGVKFTGLGDRMRTNFGGNCEALAMLLKERLPTVHEDARLMDLTPRQPRVAGAGLARVLEAMQVGPRGLEPIDLASRLVYLTSSFP